MDSQYQLESSDFLNIVVRLRTISEIDLFNELNVDVFSIDTIFSVKKIATFDLSDIRRIVEKSHSLKKKVYVSINKMIHEEDLIPLEEYLNELKNIGVDAYIISDMTVYVIAKKLHLEQYVIYQPGSMNTDSYSVEYFEARNILGITLSREITLEEIISIASIKKQLKLSLVGHGYLDMFYSKRKLLTNFAIHKNMNGSDLVNNYHLRLNEEIREPEFYPILEDEFGTHIFRSNKLISIDEFDRLGQVIDDFFIERIFIDDQEHINTIKLYQQHISKSEYLKLYKSFDSGFYYQRTEKRKGELDEN